MDMFNRMHLFGIWLLLVYITGGSQSSTEYRLDLSGLTASQSNLYSGGTGAPVNAIDGNEDTDYHNTWSCTHTNTETNPWWSVDLTKIQAITRVEILNRGDCCYDRLYDVYVYLSDSPFSTNPTLTQCGLHSGTVGNGAWGTITCAANTMGRYLTVQLQGNSRILTMCELKAYTCYCCTDNFCQNGGACTTVDGPTWQCSCKPGYTGDRCETDTCETGTLCKNGATCTRNNVDSYTCNCANGYTDQHCNTEIDECEDQTCSGHGNCEDKLAHYVCHCNDGYTGDDCETDIDECEGVNCNNGQCIDKVNDYECNCTAGYDGNHCENNINECLPDPCEHGNCKDLVNAYECECNAGYTGTDCETNIDECHGVTCSDHGTCVDGVDQYTCNCSDGYTGDNCETDFDECSSNPCENGATCNDAVNGYTCECVAGYTGDNCETNIDDCADAPCGDHGTCQDEINRFSCVCEDGYTDNLCTVYNGCHSNPCQNDGVCNDAEDGGDIDYTCDCTADYIGSNCEIETECSKSTPCINGLCVNLGNTGTEYTCTCEDQYVGEHCDIPNPCFGTSPCHNEGTCQSDDSGSHTCTCPAGYLLPNCKNTDPCHTNPCQYGGTCNLDLSFDPPTAQCTCQEGFSGENCESGPCELETPCTNECENKADSPGYECKGTNTGQGSAGALGGDDTSSDESIVGSNNALITGLTLGLACLAAAGGAGAVYIARKKYKENKSKGKSQDVDQDGPVEAWTEQRQVPPVGHTYSPGV